MSAALEPSAAGWISALGLSAGPGGDYFRQVHRAPFPGGEAEPLITVIHALIRGGTAGAMHRVSGDSLYFHHAGASLRICTVGPAGDTEVHTLSPARPQCVVAAGRWKALEVVAGAWVLISEAVVPGWTPEGHETAETSVQARPSATLAASGEPVAEEIMGEAWIAALGLRPHDEGGYFVEGWRAAQPLTTVGGARPLASTIYYLLTRRAPLGRFHRNRADITHFFHSGGPIVYSLISPAGDWHEVVLGHAHERGQVPSFTCPGGWWKNSRLAEACEHGLISEIVAPGFDYADHTIADEALLMRLFPQHRARWAGLLG